MQLFTVPLRAFTGQRPVVVVGMRDADTTVTFLCINENGSYVEIDATYLTFSRANQSPGWFDLATAIRLPVSQLNFAE